MKLIKVIPFSRAIHKESLTYFTAKDIPVGTIVTVPVRKKLVEAFVIETKDLLASKSDIKSSAFNLKKVRSIKGPSFLRPEFLKACEGAGRYFATHLGPVINALVPNIFIKQYERLRHRETTPVVEQSSLRGTTRKNKLRGEKLVLQGPLEDRLDFYKTFIRSSFANKQSVFLCLPTINEIERFAETLKRGIEEYVFVLHSDLSVQEQLNRYNTLLGEVHPVLIIATGSYLFIPRDDIGSIIVERESSHVYKTISRPFIDQRVFAELFSYEIKAKLILGDTLLRTETLWRHDKNELSEVTPLTFRLPSLARQEIVNMAKSKISKGEFEVLSARVKEVIKNTIKNREQMFLFTLRKGLAPVTVCGDCATTLLCAMCTTPMTLYTKKDKKERVFICNKCREQKSAKMVCAECGSWNLVPLGIGIERVVEEAKKDFPDVSFFRIDQEVIKTRKQGQKISDQFYNTPGSILIGTEMALSFLSERVKNTAIISFDSLFSVPGFRINEKIVQLLIRLLSYTNEKLIIQTRNPEESVLKHIASRNLTQFHREEIEQRKQFNYPPFATLIKVTFAGNKRDSDKAVKTMEELFGEYKPEIFKAYIPRIKNRYVTNMVIRLERSKWSVSALLEGGTINEPLLQKFYSLPPSWTIQVDPESLL